VLVSLSSPPDNPRGPAYADQALAAVHEANRLRRPITLYFARHADTIGLYCRSPQPLSLVVSRQLGTAYPNCTFYRLPEDGLDPSADDLIWTAELRLSPDLFAIRRYVQFEDSLNRNQTDPLTGVLATLGPAGEDSLQPRIDITLWPARPSRRRQAQRALRRLTRRFFRSHATVAALYARGVTSRYLCVRAVSSLCAGLLPHGRLFDLPELPTGTGRQHDREDDITGASDKLSRHLFEARVRLNAFGTLRSEAAARAKLHEMAAGFAQFTVPHRSRFVLSRIRSRQSFPRLRPGRGFLLSSEEVATLWHPATDTVRAEAMDTTQSRELEPPVTLPSRKGKGQEIALLGRVKYRARREVFGFLPDDRLRHLAVIGKTGMGKSTLLHNMIVSDIQAGRGVGLIDPHGDLADAILDSVPRRRTNEVVAFDAGDRDFPPAFNPLQYDRPDQRPLVASGVVSSFKKLYGDSWGPRLEHILRNSLLALLETPGTSLLSLMRLLGDASYRRSVTGRISDPVVRSFWHHEFAGWNEKFRSEAVAPIQNKIGHFLSNPILRSIVGQSKGTIDLRQLMDEGRVLVVNLSKGRIGDDASTLLGSLLVTSLQLAAMSRADTPEGERRDFFMYVDEFQNFATESFATILSEARKYRLSLTIANQYLAQMEDETADAVFGNVGSLLVFQVGARDAETLAEQLGDDARPQELMTLPRFAAYVRLLIDGMPSRPFSMETLPARVGGGRAETVRRTSRRRYCRPATQVEAEIARSFAFA